MNENICIEHVYPHALETVWQALTDPAALAQWLMPNDFRPQVGHRFRFQSKPMPGWRGYVQCQVTEVIEFRSLAYTWVGDDDWREPTVVRWTLEPVEGGTRLRLEHSNLQEPWGRELAAMLSQGWKKMLEKSIVPVLDRLAS